MLSRICIRWGPLLLQCLLSTWRVAQGKQFIELKLKTAKNTVLSSLWCWFWSRVVLDNQWPNPATEASHQPVAIIGNTDILCLWKELLEWTIWTLQCWITGTRNNWNRTNSATIGIEFRNEHWQPRWYFWGRRNEASQKCSLLKKNSSLFKQQLKEENEKLEKLEAGLQEIPGSLRIIKAIEAPCCVISTNNYGKHNYTHLFCNQQSN